MRILHPRAFTVSVFWTLGLLYLGSVVHATESSLACPDWPTCFGSMMPEMTGGVFWEHLHRLVAGGLLLMWGLAIWLVRKEVTDAPWVRRAAWAGMGLLLIQSVFGGLTVIFLLPDLVSTTHLTLALVFLSLAAALASARGWVGPSDAMAPEVASGLKRWAGLSAGLVFAQSVLGGLVRHTDAGLACPDIPLCLGQVVPPLDSGLVALHFAHRVLGIVAGVAVVALAVWAARKGAPAPVRTWANGAAALVVIQVGLGFLSVWARLEVVPVSLHSLVAASLMVVLVHLTVVGGMAGQPTGARRAPVAAAS